LEALNAEAPRHNSFVEGFVYDIIVELRNDCPIGMAGQGPIPSGSITAYCQFLDLDDRSIEYVREAIRIVEAGIAKMDADAKVRAEEQRRPQPR
jgi:hypothetical protein